MNIKIIEAKNCSTGEQKSILLSIFLSVAKMVKNKKILIVDDDSNTRDILVRALKDVGYEPYLAKDGKEGLENLDKNPALIVLDLEMPRMDGFEFLENFVEMEFEEKPNILVYSGKDLSEVQEDLLKKNVAGLVKKDEVSINQLPGMVTKLLGAKT